MECQSLFRVKKKIIVSKFCRMNVLLSMLSITEVNIPVSVFNECVELVVVNSTIGRNNSW